MRERTGWTKAPTRSCRRRVFLPRRSGSPPIRRPEVTRDDLFLNFPGWSPSVGPTTHPSGGRVEGGDAPADDGTKLYFSPCHRFFDGSHFKELRGCVRRAPAGQVAADVDAPPTRHRLHHPKEEARAKRVAFITLQHWHPLTRRSKASGNRATRMPDQTRTVRSLRTRRSPSDGNQACGCDG